jgi:hypothetical protein
MMGICHGDNPSVPTLALKLACRLKSSGSTADHADDRTN